MKKSTRVALLAGVGLALGSTAVLAQMQPPPPSPDMYGSGSLRGHRADRVLRDFDLNKDGKITKAELDKAMAQHFAAASGSAQAMTEAQFAAVHETSLHDYAEKQFRRIDWNADGVLSLAEFRAPIRARFERLDRDGSAAVSCTPPHRGVRKPHADMKGVHKGLKLGERHIGRRSGSALGMLCREADLNKDGKLTRAEFDKAVADKYAATVKGGAGMTLAEFYGLEKLRFMDREARLFKRLDKNHDGKLSEAEFAAPGERLFARLDTNKDGVLTRGELTAPRHSHRGRGKKPG